MIRKRPVQVLIATIGAATWLGIWAQPSELVANGGTLRLSDVPVGDYRMAVFTDPTPMRPGPIDVSVLVLDPASGEVVPGLVVNVEATDGANSEVSPATREQADDPERYYAAKFSIPSPATWIFTVSVDVLREAIPIHSVSATFQVRVREAGLLGNPLILSGLLLLPLIALAFWMTRGGSGGPKTQSGAVGLMVIACGLATQGACVVPDRTPPYEALAEVFAIEDARAGTLPQELLDATLVQSPMVRSAAYRALGRHERSDWIPAIALGLRDPDPEVRVVAINATAQAAHRDDAGFAGKQEAIRIFTAALGGERHPRVRAAIALAAGRLGKDSTLADAAERIILEVSTEPGEAALFDPRSISNPGAPLLDLVRGSYALARASQGTHPAQDELIVLLAELTGFGRSADASTTDGLGLNEPAVTATRIRRAALATLLATRRLSEPVVMEAARDADPGVRATLAAALRGDAPLPNREALVAQLADDPSAEVHVQWIGAYSSGPRTLGCQPLLDATQNESTHVQLAAIDALGGSCPASEHSARTTRLEEMAGPLNSAGSSAEGAWHAPAHAVAALAQIQAPSASGLAANLARHDNPFARAWAAQAYGYLGNAEALTALAHDPVPNVRTVAIGGVAKLLGPRAVPLLVEELGQTHPHLVMNSARLLEGSARTPEVMEALWSAFGRFTSAGRETDRDVRIALLDRIAELGAPADSSRLMPAFEDYDPAVAQRAAEIVGMWVGRTLSASPRPFDADPLPSADELERLDGAEVVLQMESGGTIRIELFPLIAPTNAARFARLADSGTLDGLTFHRVVPGFVIQGGSPGADEYAGHGAFSRDEITSGAHWRGTVGLSTRGRDTGDGQIFVNLLDNLRLDNEYTIYGRVVSGMDVVDGVLEGEQIVRASLVAPSP